MYRLLLVLLVFHGSASAKIKSPTKEISEAEAKSIALTLVPGKVLEVEKEKYKGEKVFSVEISGADGMHEILIHIFTGVVIENRLKQHDDEDDEDKE